MEWYVFNYDFNLKMVKEYNIFKHSRFRKEVEEALQMDNREEFEVRLHGALIYYFWHKAEYEIIIFPWCGADRINGVKFDIYQQIKMNWNTFSNYVWSMKNV